MGLFSIMTVICGLAAQFWQLLIARVFTGVGEAGTGPSAQAVISDLYPPEEARRRAELLFGRAEYRNIAGVLHRRLDRADLRLA